MALPVFSKVVSLGMWCGVAHYLQQRQWKTESYPFDWNFETCQSIRMCLEDDFAKFLDVSKIINGRNPALPGHAYGHIKDLKDPLQYQYYLRCVNRMRDLKNYGGHLLFVVVPRPHSSTDTTVEEEDEQQLLFKCVNSMFPKAWILYCHQILDPNESISKTIDVERRLIYGEMHVKTYLNDGNWAQTHIYHLWNNMFNDICINVTQPRGIHHASVICMEQNHSKNSIKKASYGIKHSMIDVTLIVKKLVQNSGSLIVSNQLFGDPAYGYHKHLVIKYHKGHKEKYNEGQSVSICN